MVVIERDRQMRERPGNEPDILMLHPIDAEDLFYEISHKYPWSVSPPKTAVEYRQFYGMDIMVTPLMTPGNFVVGKRRPIKVWAIDGPPKGPVTAVGKTG